MADDGIVQYPRGAWVIKQFADGPARAWEADPAMPKLRDVALGPVVYLFRSPHDAKAPALMTPDGALESSRSGKALAASGCLIEVQTKARTHQYVVTNRHVVLEGCVTPRFSFMDGHGEHGYVIDAVESEWYCKIVETDLAVLPIHDELVENNVHGVRFGNFLSPIEYRSGWGAIGDEVAMPGRFFYSSGGAINEPVTRFGNIAASGPVQLRLEGIQEPQEVILADMRSHTGYSGSPAFIFGGIADEFTRQVRELEERIRSLADSMDNQYSDQRWQRQMYIDDLDLRQIRFLGIDHGHVGENMTAIIPWFKVQELLESPKLVKLREERDASLSSGVTPD